MVKLKTENESSRVLSSVGFFLPGRSLLERRLLKDRWIALLVSGSGVAVIGFILAIFFVILVEVYPLFKAPEVVSVGGFKVAGNVPLAVGVDEYQEAGFLVTAAGIKAFSLKTRKELPAPDLSELNGADISGASTFQNNLIVLGLSDGRILPVKINFPVSYPEGEREVGLSVLPGEAISIHPEGKPVSRLTHISSEAGQVIAAVTGDHRVTVLAIKEKKTLMGTTRKTEDRAEFVLPNRGEIRALSIGREGGDLFAGTVSGQIIHVPLDDSEDKIEILGAATKQGQGVTTMGFLNGGMTMVVGDDGGGVNSFQFLTGKEDSLNMRRVHRFDGHLHPTITFHASIRDKGFITGDSAGFIRYHYGTSGESQLEVRSTGDEKLGLAILSPKGDGIFSVHAGGWISQWQVENPHPDISLGTLFQKVQYEGYPEPEYVWQSTGGTDEFESKASLIPLIFGTIKGTVYALLFSGPIALFAAFYTSQFMSAGLRELVKPSIEFMAGIPSVVLGFFAALWLAPQVDQWLPGLLLMPLVTAVLVFIFFMAGRIRVARDLIFNNPGLTFLCLFPLVIFAGFLTVEIGAVLESIFMDGNYRAWVLDVMGLSYDQRNSVIVGMALGFVVVPIIFTIAEDALSSVPRNLTAASLALGASRWETAVRVVLPVASPGIFSGVMIGFSRAVGETMIVLMATGNTPVMDWNVFSGFRALAANIAVELPEAPEGGTLFRILFLAALMLFIATFFINTVAEWVRLRLREKYKVI